MWYNTIHHGKIMALLCVCDYFHYAPAKLMWITDENNRRIIGMLGRIISVEVYIYINFKVTVVEGRVITPLPEIYHHYVMEVNSNSTVP